MKAQVDEQQQTRYLVELRAPRDGWDALEALAGRARSNAAELRAEGVDVRFLRTVFVPEDEACFLLYEASSADVAVDAARRAELSVARVLEAVSAEKGKEEG